MWVGDLRDVALGYLPAAGCFLLEPCHFGPKQGCLQFVEPRVDTYEGVVACVVAAIVGEEPHCVCELGVIGCYGSCIAECCEVFCGVEAECCGVPIDERALWLGVALCGVA